MNATPCPFCGLVTDLPHETQEACIEALHAEIARVRVILNRVKEPYTNAQERGRRFEAKRPERERGDVLREDRVKTKDAALVL